MIFNTSAQSILERTASTNFGMNRKKWVLLFSCLFNFLQQSEWLLLVLINFIWKGINEKLLWPRGTRLRYVGVIYVWLSFLNGFSLKELEPLVVTRANSVNFFYIQFLNSFFLFFQVERALERVYNRGVHARIHQLRRRKLMEDSDLPLSKN